MLAKKIALWTSRFFLFLFIPMWHIKMTFPFKISCQLKKQFKKMPDIFIYEMFRFKKLFTLPSTEFLWAYRGENFAATACWFLSWACPDFNVSPQFFILPREMSLKTFLLPFKRKKDLKEKLKNNKKKMTEKLFFFFSSKNDVFFVEEVN